MPLLTPFHSRTLALNQRQAWRDWSGYLVAAGHEPPHERLAFILKRLADQEMI